MSGVGRHGVILCLRNRTAGLGAAFLEGSPFSYGSEAGAGGAFRENSTIFPAALDIVRGVWFNIRCFVV